MPFRDAANTPTKFKMESFATIVNSYNPLTIVANLFILDDCSYLGCVSVFIVDFKPVFQRIFVYLRTNINQLIFNKSSLEFLLIKSLDAKRKQKNSLKKI